MKFEFNQGVPKECIEWLWENIGAGNITRFKACDIRSEPRENDDWCYERVEHEIHSNNPYLDSNCRYVPTIFINDEIKAALFKLRWS
jgi:hypothetical protein